MEPRILEVRTKILKKNDELARSMRARFQDLGVFVSNWVSSPGSGKTALLEVTLRELFRRGFSVSAIVGDLETDRDAARLARSGAPVRQIMTHGCCHLEADMIERELAHLPLTTMDFLFIENVGNLVCPTSWDLGESLRIALLSVTEGEDKPLKYPGLFNTSDVVIITKSDLATACDFDRTMALSNIESIQPNAKIFELSTKTGLGLEKWFDYLEERMQTDSALTHA
jgi:hydrogenase nickel incorporation protein HypB